MMRAPPRPFGAVPLLLLLLLSGAHGSEDDCTGGHVVATATDVDFFPFCCVQDSGILMSSWQASGYDIAAFENLYVTVHNGSYSWPPSDYLIANAMTFVLERDDGNYYYFKYNDYFFNRYLIYLIKKSGFCRFFYLRFQKKFSLRNFANSH